MSVYRVELRTQLTSPYEISDRFPSIQELKDAIDGYKVTGQGIIVTHNSLFDYRYDTESSDYHKVDSAGIIGHILDSFISNSSGVKHLYLIIDFNNNFDPEKKYILYYRATIQTDPRKQDHKLHFDNLFAVDLITVLDKEITEATQLSQVIDYSEEWKSRLRNEAALKEIGL